MKTLVALAIIFGTVGFIAFGLISSGHPWLGFFLMLGIAGAVKVHFD